MEMQFLLEKRAEFEVMSEEEERRVAYRARIEASPAEFFKESWKILEPGKPLEWSWHYDLIGEYLHAAFKQQIRRLIISVPYRTGKSNFVTITWPAWGWARKPSSRFFTSSYSGTLSTDHSVKRRRLIESAWYQNLWPLTFDRSLQDQYSNTKTGEMIASSVGATTTGRGGDILILDDGLSADEARSKASQKNLHEWYVNTFKNRLDDPANGVIVVVEQRTSDQDMTGWLLRNEPGDWTHIVVPTECEATTEYSFPISGRKFVREVGDILQPNRHPPAVIKSRKIHARTWATQDQQRPTPDSGIVFMRQWWENQRRGVMRAKYDQIITSWDFAVEGNAEHDFNCGICLGKIDADIDVIDVIKKKVPFTQQLTTVTDFLKKHPYATRHLVEKKANGPAIISSLKSKVPGLIAVEPQGSKLQRADAATPEVESGNVYLVEGDWVLDFIESLCAFPNGANDDDVDAFAQAVNWLRGHNYSYGLLGYAKQFENAEDKAREEFMERAKNVGKVDYPDNAQTCPKCESRAVVRIGSTMRCNGCGNQWPALASDAKPNPAYNRGDALRK